MDSFVFFARELVTQIVLNMDSWYSAPLTIVQVVCEVLMGTSLLLVVASHDTLRQYGNPYDSRNDVPLLRFENQRYWSPTEYTVSSVTHVQFADLS